MKKHFLIIFKLDKWTKPSFKLLIRICYCMEKTQMESSAHLSPPSLYLHFIWKFSANKVAYILSTLLCEHNQLFLIFANYYEI